MNCLKAKRPAKFVPHILDKPFKTLSNRTKYFFHFFYFLQSISIQKLCVSLYYHLEILFIIQIYILLASSDKIWELLYCAVKEYFRVGNAVNLFLMLFQIMMNKSSIILGAKCLYQFISVISIITHLLTRLLFVVSSYKGLFTSCDSNFLTRLSKLLIHTQSAFVILPFQIKKMQTVLLC